MGRRTQAPIRHEDIPRLEGRMDRLHPGKIVRQEWRDHPRQEHTGARVEQPS
jgi:hypothetical protein